MTLRSVLPGLALAACLFSLPACAQFYAGVAGGRSNADIDCSGTLTCDRNATAWKAFGGYQFHPNFGAEAAYYRQGTATLTALIGEGATGSGDFKGHGMGVYALALAREGAWSVFGKLGAVSSKVTGVARVADLSQSVSERHTAAAWGGGIGVDFTRNFGGRLEFERVRAELLGERINVDLVTAALVGRF